MDDTISRQAAIDGFYEMASDMDHLCTVGDYVSFLESLPPAQPETYKEKLKEIADALSEKFAYMNTCLNERDIILGYLGVKRPSKTHCNTDCTNIKCESHSCNKRLPSAQPQWIPCSERLPEYGHPVLWCNEQGSVFVSAITYQNGNSWNVGKRHRGCDVLAWMPIPEPYKGGD